jgi:hypothetical protein
MSKGPGRIERAIATVLDATQDSAFTAEELCRRIYPEIDPYALGSVQKKHRIAVIRGGKRLAERRPEFTWWRSGGRASEIIFCRRDNLTSYAMGRLKAMYHHFGRERRTENQLRAMLAGNALDYHWRAYLKPGPEGYWWREVELFLAERDGDAEKVARLTAEAKRQAQINEMKLRALMRG